MLTPIDTHYLVGLLTLVSSTEDIEIELGSMVMDTAAKKKRDVDVTVTYKSQDGNISAFKGIEVKDHTRPLNVSHIEQLCAKLNDMPSISHRAIVSASGYTKPAITKAQHYKVELFHLLPWNNPAQGFNVAFSDQFEALEKGLQWQGSPHVQFNPDQVIPSEIRNKINMDAQVCDSSGNQLSHCKNLGELATNLANNALRQLDHQSRDQIQPGWTGPVSLNVEVSDRPFLSIKGTRIAIERALITGSAKYVEVPVKHEFKILRKHGETKPFVRCAITELTNGNLMGLTVTSDSSTLKLINIPLSDRLREKIYRQKLKQTFGESK
jgi:hypothetical protein